MARKSRSKSRSRRSRRSRMSRGAPRERLVSKKGKDGKVIPGMEGTQVGTIAVGRGGLAWKVVRLPSGKKAWRLCKNPVADPELFETSPHGRTVLSKKGRRLSKRRRGSSKCSGARRRSAYEHWVTSHPKGTAGVAEHGGHSGHGLPTKRDLLREQNMRNGSKYFGKNGKAYELTKNKKTGHYSWKLCRGSLVDGKWKTKVSGRKLSKAQKKRPRCSASTVNPYPYSSGEGVSSGILSVPSLGGLFGTAFSSEKPLPVPKKQLPALPKKSFVVPKKALPPVPKKKEEAPSKGLFGEGGLWGLF